MEHLLPADWRTDPQLWIEGFVTANFAGLVLDIFLAHSTNHFRLASEYIPLYFSAAAALALLLGLVLRRRAPAAWRRIGLVVGWLAVLVGLTGVILHLDSQFFHERTLKSLTYAAPFAAPLAYAGLGLLLIANRMVPAASIEWAQWMLLLALGGFAGNFVFSLSDHAMNGFFNPAEWIPVVSSAFAVSFLIVPFMMTVSRQFLAASAAILGVQAFVGVIGFGLHFTALSRQAGTTLLERVLAGAPPMAPLLFPNLVILGLIGLWALDGALREARLSARP
jgi:hypothetical protein